MHRFAAVLIFGIASLLCAAPATVAPRQDYAAVARALTPFIEHELADKELPAISVALVDDQQIVWAQGFGFADPDKKTAAAADTIYRVGSVSKLFTDIGIMQLVERGELSLDAPITGYLPDFHPANPFHKPITLRELMSHRSGLVREPPVGHYFDPTEPSLAATVGSMNETKLVYEPGIHTKYSNAGITVVGYVLERRKKEPYTKYLKRAVLTPMGLNESAFEPEPELVRHLAKAYMWTYDGRVFEAPTFQLGIGPAGCLYTSVIDLGHFLSVLFARGRDPHGPVLKPETLDEMWKPQFAKPGETAGFGIGFRLSKFEGHRAVGHGGAIYGFATELAALPDDKLGVVAVTTKDSSNAVTNHIAHEALRLMLAARAGKPLPEIHVTRAVDPALARRLDGHYGQGAKAIDLTERNGKLYELPAAGGERVSLRQSGDSLTVDGRLAYGTRIDPEDDSVLIDKERRNRVAVPKPPPAPERWRGLIGEYGWDHDILYILEKDGKLTALIEWYDYYPLTEISKNVFRFPGWGLYDGETLTFQRDAGGRASEARVSAVVFKRRAIAGETQTSASIEPLEPVTELRRKALAASPPHETGGFRKPDLVELTALDPTIKLDIRYATTNNFMRTVFYPEARAFMQRPAAEALVRAHRKLKEKGYGLLIHDAYRPWFVTKMFWDGTPPDKRIFVADPSQGSRHNRGCAVDLTLYDLATGKPVEMVGLYDEMSERSYPDYPGGTSLARWDRKLLRRAMEAEGFTVYDFEWWHFDYKDWPKYPILNVRAGAF
ncbi:MAG TPA: serine hydrolase [Bryobacteraceae bacterium]|nr:serine hydrolase [Bryobacteraceae bacterium]